MPEGIHDRDADVWESMLALADAAGGEWPERARVTAVTLVTLARERTPSLGLRLLSDVRSVLDGETISTENLIERLKSLDKSPWLDIRGKPLDGRGLAARLRHYPPIVNFLSSSNEVLPVPYCALRVKDRSAFSRRVRMKRAELLEAATEHLSGAVVLLTAAGEDCLAFEVEAIVDRIDFSGVPIAVEKRAKDPSDE